MLSRDEAHRLAAILGIIREDKIRGITHAEEYTLETIEFLATHLRALDIQAAKFYDLVQRKDDQIAELCLKLDQLEGKA